MEAGEVNAVLEVEALRFPGAVVVAPSTRVRRANTGQQCRLLTRSTDRVIAVEKEPKNPKWIVVGSGIP